MPEFQEALERIVAGPERKSRIISDAEKLIIAYHEGGHAVVQRILPKCDPVSKVTIISRGMALGYTMALPPGGPLPPEQDRVRGQDRRHARRQRLGAARLRRHDDRRQQRHREGDRSRPADGHRVRDERPDGPARLRQARRDDLPRPRDRRAAQLLGRRRPPDRRGGPDDHRDGLLPGARTSSPVTGTSSTSSPRRSSRRRRSTPRSSRRSSPTCRRRSRSTASCRSCPRPRPSRRPSRPDRRRAGRPPRSRRGGLDPPLRRSRDDNPGDAPTPDPRCGGTS